MLKLGDRNLYLSFSATDMCEELPPFYGCCIGRQLFGKRCAFFDLVEVPPPSSTLAPSSGDSGDALRINQVGDHVAREVPLSVQNLIGSALDTVVGEVAPTIYSVYVGLSENSLSQESFDRLTAALESPGEISRPRLGDVFLVHGVRRERAPRNAPLVDEKVAGCPVLKNVNAVELVLVSRGDVARPGDFATKWNLPKKGERPLKPPGRPRRHGNRFKVFAQWCMQNLVDGGASGPNPPFVLDIAGGSGKLSEVFANRFGCKCTVVDPRSAAFLKALCTGDGAVNVVESYFVDPTSYSADSNLSQGIVVNDANLLLLKDAIRDSSMIVGLHCDGAVNEIVRVACSHKKNFAIVACCVFPKLFPRTLNDGRPVVDRSELNQWIVEEAIRLGFPGEVGTTTLTDFDGANVLVYGKLSPSPTAS